MNTTEETLSGVYCPRCGKSNIYDYGNVKEEHFQCQSCGHVFWNPKVSNTQRLKILILLYGIAKERGEHYRTLMEWCDYGWEHNRIETEKHERLAAEYYAEISNMIQEVKDEVYNGIGE